MIVPSSDTLLYVRCDNVTVIMLLLYNTYIALYCESKVIEELVLSCFLTCCCWQSKEELQQLVDRAVEKALKSVQKGSAAENTAGPSATNASEEHEQQQEISDVSQKHTLNTFSCCCPYQAYSQYIEMLLPTNSVQNAAAALHE